SSEEHRVGGQGHDIDHGGRSCASVGAPATVLAAPVDDPVLAATRSDASAPTAPLGGRFLRWADVVTGAQGSDHLPVGDRGARCLSGPGGGRYGERPRRPRLPSATTRRGDRARPTTPGPRRGGCGSGRSTRRSG